MRDIQVLTLNWKLSLWRRVRWKGSEGSKQAEHTTRKLTPWWFLKCTYIFFENLPAPFLGILVLKIRHFFPICLLYRLWYGKDTDKSHAKCFLTSCLVSNASLVTKSCNARFFDDDAFSPSPLGHAGWLQHGSLSLTYLHVDKGVGQIWSEIRIHEDQLIPNV